MAAKPGTSPSSDDRLTDTMRWIGRYRLGDEIGRGAWGIVYRALDPAIGRDLAIKELPLSQVRRKELDLPRLEADEIPDARRRFVREAQVVGRLNHDNIVTLHDFIEEEDALYLVMEYFPRGSLHRLIKAETPLTAGEILGIVRQVASALDEAHANDIIHRDIKPGNILVGKDRVRGGPVVKVADFGIARISSQPMTTTLGVMGTPPYMAPEQFRGSRADEKTDQFSLGVVAYQLLGRRLPFTAPGDRDEPPSLLEANRDLSPEVDRVIRKALAKNPVQRFANCSTFADALDRALWSVEPPTRITKPGIDRMLLAAAWGALLAVAVAVVLYLGGRVIERRAAQSSSVEVAKGAEPKTEDGAVKKETYPRGRETAPHTTARTVSQATATAPVAGPSKTAGTPKRQSPPVRGGPKTPSGSLTGAKIDSPTAGASRPLRAASPGPKAKGTNLGSGEAWMHGPLMWTKQDNGKAIDWDGAVKYCRNLGLGDYHDWRLPEIGELQEIRNSSQAALTSNFYWSATKDGSGAAWNLVSRSWGRVSLGLGSGVGERALCVRDVGRDSNHARLLVDSTSSKPEAGIPRAVTTATAPAANQPRIDSPRATWLDETTRLMWTTQDNSGEILDWNDAARNCANLKVGKYNDWRLPEIGDLQGIYDPSQSSHTKGRISVTSHKWYWSAPKEGSGAAWHFFFDTGGRYAVDPARNGLYHRALCVRRAGE